MIWSAHLMQPGQERLQAKEEIHTLGHLPVWVVLEGKLPVGGLYLHKRSLTSVGYTTSPAKKAWRNRVRARQTKPQDQTTFRIKADCVRHHMECFVRTGIHSPDPCSSWFSLTDSAWLTFAQQKYTHMNIVVTDMYDFGSKSIQFAKYYYQWTILVETYKRIPNGESQMENPKWRIPNRESQMKNPYWWIPTCGNLLENL